MPLAHSRADTILVIDDDPLVHDLMTRVLGKEGFRVVCAASGKEGLALAKSLRPVAITLDVVMPGMDGWAVLTALKGDPDLAEIPVVIVTMTDDRQMGYALGAADYLNKPVDPVRLTNILRRFAPEIASPSLLIVEDDDAMREIDASSFEQRGLGRRVAVNGRTRCSPIVGADPNLICWISSCPRWMDSISSGGCGRPARGGTFR